LNDPFGVPLERDPGIALQPLDLRVMPKSGPLHKVQFVIEFVGPRSMPANIVAQLLTAQWYEALGRPNLFAMRPADLQWQPLTDAADGSYDSLALSWDFISPQGQITGTSAKHLMQFAERFGPHIQRRPMPLPPPNEVDRTVRELIKAQEALDIGFSLLVVPRQGAFAEKDVWVECARLGLDFAPGGSFDWRLPGHPYPLLSVHPAGDEDSFSLANVQAGVSHPGLTVGFSLPLCIAPAQALEGCIYVAEHFAMDLDGQVYDPDERPLNDREKGRLRSGIKQALAMFSQLGITTGSPEAQKLFGA
jgi:hypothetical protein